MTDSSVALLCGALRWLKAGEVAEVHYTLDELPEDELGDAIELVADFLDRLRQRRRVLDVRTEMAVSSS